MHSVAGLAGQDTGAWMRGPAEWSVDIAALDRARILRGWTRRDLARQARLDEGTLCDLFAGRRHPTFGTLRALCRPLELSLDDLIAFVPQTIQE